MVHHCKDCCPIPTLGLAVRVEEQVAIPVGKEMSTSRIVKEEIYYMKVVALFATLMETRRRKRSRRCPRRKVYM